MSPALPIVTITGDATSETRTRAAEAGAFDVLPQPFDETELLTLVRRALPPAGVAREEDAT